MNRPEQLPRWSIRNVRRALSQLVLSTVRSCMEHRVTGMAGEAAFFALLSLPPLIFGLAGSIGYIVSRFNEAQVGEIRETVLDLASRALTPDTVETVIRPTLDNVLSGGRYDVVSIGFILALWSGSRALYVFVDTITIMYGLKGHRGILQTRALSFLLYLFGLVTGIVGIPLVVAGPHLVDLWLPERFDFLNALYWPLVVGLSVCFLATLYHVSVPVRTKWRFNLPGALFAMFCWIVGSSLLRAVLLSFSEESTSIFGPLAAPIVVLLWLYLLSIVVLIGAALNAAFDEVWPEAAVASAREELRERLARLSAAVRSRAEDNSDASGSDRSTVDP